MRDKRKSAVPLVVLALAALAFVLLLKYLGLFAPRTRLGFGSLGFGRLTINEPLSNIVGYLVALLVLLYFGGLVYAHFDRKRRLYNLCLRMVGPVRNGMLKLFGLGEKSR